MLLRIELLNLSLARMADAKLLFRNKSYDGAVYLSGYTIEFALKARICKQLRWAGYPSTDNEFRGKGNFKTHDFEILLQFTGMAPKINNDFRNEWTVMKEWSPEYRYRPIGTATQSEARRILTASKKLAKTLSKT